MMTLFLSTFHCGLLGADEHPKIGEAAYQGKPTHYWREKLRAEETELGWGARPLFAAEDPTAIPVLIQLLRDKDPAIRAHVAHSLSTMGGALEDVVPALVQALNDPDRIVRVYALLSLAKVNPSKHGTVSLFIASLTDKEICVLISAAQALGMVGPKAKTATAALARALEDEDSYVRVKAAQALYRIDRRQVNVVIPILIQGLKDENSSRRRGAAKAIKARGPDAKPAVNALTEALGDDELMFYAAEALGAIGPDAKSAFLPLLKIVNEMRAERKPFWWARDAMMLIDPKAVDQAKVPEDE
jgi:HEAT repeat protein